jgi:hypothetical protein
MQIKNAKMLPKTTSEIQNGGVYLQAVRCGKPTCKCARGETHSAFYFFTRRNGKLIKIYVRKAEVDDFSRLVVRASLERYAQRQINKTNFQLLQAMRQSLHEKQGIINSLRGI